MQEFKKRFFTFLWGVGYTVLALVVTFVFQNVDLVQAWIATLQHPYDYVAFALLTVVLQQGGKALRNTGNMPLVK